jgi:type I restriction enzyme, S subunit
MNLCDLLESATRQREFERDALSASSLHFINQEETDSQAILEQLPRISTRKKHVKALRQTILNLAVRGKLVAQDKNDEPASVLLEKIDSLPRPARYAKRSPETISGDCGLSIGDPKTPVPQGWTRVPLIEIATIESGHTPSRNRSDWWDGDVSWVGLVDARIHNGGVINETIQHTNEKGIANSAARILPAGTVCFSRTASVGYVVIMGKPMATSQDFVNWVPTKVILSEWLQLVLIAEKTALSRFSKGAVHQTIYYPEWLALHIVLPPLEEQKRIVAKVNSLMGLCDLLEAGLQSQELEQQALLESVLHFALAG